MLARARGRRQGGQASRGSRGRGSAERERAEGPGSCARSRSRYSPRLGVVTGVDAGHRQWLGAGARSPCAAPLWAGAQRSAAASRPALASHGHRAATPASHPRTRPQLAQSPSCSDQSSSLLFLPARARPLSRRHRTEPRGAILKRLCATLLCSPSRTSPPARAVQSVAPQPRPRPRPRTAASLAARLPTHPPLAPVSSATPRSSAWPRAVSRSSPASTLVPRSKTRPRALLSTAAPPTAHRCTHRPHRQAAALRPLRPLTFLSSHPLRPTPTCPLRQTRRRPLHECPNVALARPPANRNTTTPNQPSGLQHASHHVFTAEQWRVCDA